MVLKHILLFLEPKSDHDDDDKEEAKSEHPEEAASPQQPAVARREPVSVLSRVLDCTGQSNRNAGMLECPFNSHKTCFIFLYELLFP